MIMPCLCFMKVYTAELSHGSVSDEAAYRAGLQPIKEWRAFGLQGFPGIPDVYTLKHEPECIERKTSFRVPLK